MSTSVASVVSHFPSAENGFTTTTSGSVSSGAVTVGLNSVAGYANGEIAVFVIDPTDATKKQTFTGTIDTAGTQVTSVVWTAGTNQTHALGATVVDYATATHISMVTKGLLVAHNQDGTHKTSLALVTPKITTSINDSSGNEVIKTPATASAVNEITVTNSAAGNAVTITTTGDDSNIPLTITPKGTGALTLTNLYMPYKFRVSRNAAANTGNGAFAVIAFDTEQFDAQNYVASGVFTVPVAGFYQFNWAANTTTVGSETFIASLFVGGVEKSRGLQNVINGQPISSVGADLIQLAASDTVDIRAFCTATRALNVGTTYGNFFSGFLVSRT